MKCSAAHPWLLAAKTTPELPAAVQQHLRDCPDCRLQHRRLLRLNQEMRDLPAPAENPAARACFWQKFDELPPRGVIPIRTSGRRRRLVFGAAGAAAAVLLLGLGLGLLLGPRNSPERPEPPPIAALQPTYAATDRQILVQAIEHDLRLAQTQAPAERFQALAALSTDLDGEASRLAREGRMDDLAQVTALYDRVVRHGLVERARTLPAGQKAERVQAAVRQLEQTERQARLTADGALPVMGDHLRHLAAAARDGVKALHDDARPPALIDAPAPTAGPRPLLGALVMNGLRLAAEDDPLRRADYCTDVADQLVQTILQASATGDAEQASRLGTYLGQLVEMGVVKNLERVPSSDLEGTRLHQWEEIGARLVKTTDVLERNLAKAPEAARPGLERAIEASSLGRMDQGKGQKGKGKLPPGLEKRLMRDKGKGKSS